MEANLGGESIGVSVSSVSTCMNDNIRDMHQQLLVSVTLELRIRVESFRPWFLHYSRTRLRVSLIQCVDRGEVDLFVYVVLESGCEVVCVVMRGAFGMVMAVMVVFIMAVRHVGSVVECGVEVNVNTVQNT